MEIEFDRDDVEVWTDGKRDGFNYISIMFNNGDVLTYVYKALEGYMKDKTNLIGNSVRRLGYDKE